MPSVVTGATDEHLPDCGVLITQVTHKCDAVCERDALGSEKPW